MWTSTYSRRLSKVAAEPSAYRTSDFVFLVEELGYIMNQTYYALQVVINHANSPAFTPSKATRDSFDVFRDKYNQLAENYAAFVETLRRELGVEINFYPSAIKGLK